MPLLPSCPGSCGKLEKLLLPLPGFDRECHSRRTVVFVFAFLPEDEDDECFGGGGGG